MGQWFIGKERGNPGWFVPPGSADRPPSVTLMTPGMCYLSLGASVSQKNSDKQHQGKRTLQKENTLNCLGSDGPAAAEKCEKASKIHSHGEVESHPHSSFIPYSLEGDKEHHFPKLWRSQVWWKEQGERVRHFYPTWGLWAKCAPCSSTQYSAWEVGTQ